MMKRFILAAVCLFIGTIGFAQDGVSVKGNTITMKDSAPIWPGCEKSDLKVDKCLNQKVNEHIKKNFKYPKNDAGEYVRGKATISYTIDENGKVTNVKAEGPQKLINDEITRVIKSFPTMKPGRRGGKAVAINQKMILNF